MKGLLLVLAATLLAPLSYADRAVLTSERPGAAPGCMLKYTPIKLTLAGPAALPWGNWDVYGLEIGVWNSTAVMKGLQIGVVNATDGFCGLQIGAVNVTRIGSGFQIGVVNVVRGSDCPFLPVVNWAF